MKTRTLGSLLAAALVASAPAATLIQWDTTGLAGNEETFAPTFVDSNLTGMSLARGAGLTTSSANNNFAAANWTGEATDYFTLGFSVASGYSVDINTLTFATRSSNTGPGSVGIYYSVDGFTTPLATIDQSPGSNYVNTISDLNLSGLTGDIEFRFIQIGTTSANGGTTSSTGTYRIGDYFDSESSTYIPITFDGSIAAVPEPATIALLGLGFGAVLWQVRRRRS